MDIQDQIQFLENVYELDQRDRLFPADHAEKKLDAVDRRREMEEQDALNRQNIEMYIGRYGWPRLSVHGDKGCAAAFLVIQHSELSVIEKYFPLLQQRVAEKEAHAYYAAMMEDRMLMYQGKSQKYGSQARFSEKKQGMYIWPIENIEAVEAYRRQAGFRQTIKEYAVSLNAIFDPSIKIEFFS